MASQKYKNILKSSFVKEIIEVSYNMWKMGWAERNAGNISYLIDNKTAKSYFNINKSKKNIKLDINISDLSDKIFLVTGTGKYFKNIVNDPSVNLGVIKVSENGGSIDVLWGFDGGTGPTSELTAHLLSHKERLKIDPEHKVIIHTHTTNLIAMTALHDIDDKLFTKTLWSMCTECLVVFPEGVGMLPWMVPGTKDIGLKTAEKMKNYRIVIWPCHGIFGTGKNVDETMGLIETVEKAASIYIKINSCGKAKNEITDDQFRELARYFNITPKKGIIDN